MKNGFYFDDFEITYREILMSISIFAVMILMGILISTKISEHQMDKNAVYNKAIKLESQELFQYAIDTNIGNAFVYGELKAVDGVTFPEISGEYMTVKKVEEHYTMHDRTVYDHDKDGNVTGSHKEYYWTWDEYKKWDKSCSKVTFLGIEFDFSQINYDPQKSKITTLDGGYHVRYVYYGSGVSYMGTIFTTLSNHSINNTLFYNGKTIEKTIKYLESNAPIIIFWIIWIIFSGGAIWGFYYLDNNWLY